ncbi:hypothetical protein KUCAC02_011356 [Chaenocephalus aceratus]|uniref:Uncharacterized protein n=1 Tax=Chaenocephalus aceratus TaxID=36190 RepID=A0ACB9WX40_CHAAC|nr:hypothetical protein KUCAC02_011356 [Chaenocephalus aceratus]
MITLLCKPENELNAAIPSANPTKTLQGSEVVNVLRSQLAQLDEMKRERSGDLEEEINAVDLDMSTVFLTSLAQDGAISEEQMSLLQARPVYGAYNQRTSHQEFSSLKQSNTEANQREEVLKKLASAHDSYVEISNNLREGTKFYNDLTEILLKQSGMNYLRTCSRASPEEPSAPSFNVPAYQSAPAAPCWRPDPCTENRLYRTASAGPAAAPPDEAQSPSQASSTELQPQAASPNPATTPTGPPNSNPQPLAPPSQAQGPPYPATKGEYYQMPMGYNPYAYGQYNMPYMPYQQTPGQGGYPAAPPGGQPYPGYPQQPPQQQPY